MNEYMFIHKTQTYTQRHTTHPNSRSKGPYVPDADVGHDLPVVGERLEVVEVGVAGRHVLEDLDGARQGHVGAHLQRRAHARAVQLPDAGRADVGRVGPVVLEDACGS